MSKIRLALVPKRTVQPSLFVTIIKCDGHHDNVSLETKRKENMAKKDKAPRYVRVANVMTTALLARYFGVTADSSLEEFERSEEHTSELQSPDHLVCRLLLEKKKTNYSNADSKLHMDYYATHTTPTRAGA